MSIPADARAWVEVDLTALRQNYRTLAKLVGPDVRQVVMVKADGYGLGAVRVARNLEPLQPWGYGVATVEEGIALRRAGIRRPILVSEPLPPAAVADAADSGLTASISHLSQLERWAAAARQHPSGLDFHVEIDTGMGRCGLDWREASSWGPVARGHAAGPLRWTGTFTHFHSADAADRSAVDEQWSRFQAALGRLPHGEAEWLVHAANSAATLRFPEYHAHAIRPGLFLYGGDPLLLMARAGEEVPPRAEAVVSLRARVTLVREVPPGTTVGYGATYRSVGWERWATLGIGYGDGLPRALSNNGSVLIRGQRAPIVGRISMDLVVVNVTGILGVEVNEIATLIGRDGTEEITLEEVAGQAGTINHEILTGLSPRLPRVEIDAGPAE